MAFMSLAGMVDSGVLRSKYRIQRILSIPIKELAVFRSGDLNKGEK